MKTTVLRILAGSLTALVSSVALAQDMAPPGPPPADTPPPPTAQTAPPQAPPEGLPPAEIPPPAVAPGAFPPGQWVSTAQYGYVWMPYDQAYTYAPPAAGADPYMYMYSPAYGWRWLAAPWVFGIGPQPYFGRWGYARFGWYGHGWYGHPWYGYRAGYPAGYHGVIYSHRGAWGRPVVVGPRGPARVEVAPGHVRREVRRGERREEHR